METEPGGVQVIHLVLSLGASSIGSFVNTVLNHGPLCRLSDIYCMTWESCWHKWPVCFSLEKAMTPDSSTLAWKILWMEEPSRLQSMGSLRVRQDWATSLSLFTFMHWKRKWQPTPVFLPGESQGEPGGLLSMGSYRVGHDWSDLAAVVRLLPCTSSYITIFSFPLSQW